MEINPNPPDPNELAITQLAKLAGAAHLPEDQRIHKIAQYLLALEETRSNNYTPTAREQPHIVGSLFEELRGKALQRTQQIQQMGFFTKLWRSGELRRETQTLMRFDQSLVIKLRRLETYKRLNENRNLINVTINSNVTANFEHALKEYLKNSTSFDDSDYDFLDTLYPRLDTEKKAAFSKVIRAYVSDKILQGDVRGAFDFLSKIMKNLPTTTQAILNIVDTFLKPENFNPAIATSIQSLLDQTKRAIRDRISEITTSLNNNPEIERNLKIEKNQLSSLKNFLLERSDQLNRTIGNIPSQRALRIKERLIHSINTNDFVNNLKIFLEKSEPIDFEFLNQQLLPNLPPVKSVEFKLALKELFESWLTLNPNPSRVVGFLDFLLDHAELRDILSDLEPQAQEGLNQYLMQHKNERIKIDLLLLTTTVNPTTFSNVLGHCLEEDPATLDFTFLKKILKVLPQDKKELFFNTLKTGIESFLADAGTRSHVSAYFNQFFEDPSFLQMLSSLSPGAKANLDSYLAQNPQEKRKFDLYLSINGTDQNFKAALTAFLSDPGSIDFIFLQKLLKIIPSSTKELFFKEMETHFHNWLTEQPRPSPELVIDCFMKLYDETPTICKILSDLWPTARINLENFLINQIRVNANGEYNSSALMLIKTLIDFQIRQEFDTIENTPIESLDPSVRSNVLGRMAARNVLVSGILTGDSLAKNLLISLLKENININESVIASRLRSNASPRSQIDQQYFDIIKPRSMFPLRRVGLVDEGKKRLIREAMTQVARTLRDLLTTLFSGENVEDEEMKKGIINKIVVSIYLNQVIRPAMRRQPELFREFATFLERYDPTLNPETDRRMQELVDSILQV